jgi:hypothetical protein
MADGVATASSVKSVESMFVAMKVSVLGRARVSSGSSLRMLAVHFERGRWLRVLREFGLAWRKVKTLIMNSSQVNPCPIDRLIPVAVRTVQSVAGAV